jgi:hypothetical protein
MWDIALKFLDRYKFSILMFLVLALPPFAINMFALWLYVGQATFQELINGNYMCWWGFECNPLPDIIWSLLVFSFMLSLFIQLSIFLSSKLFRSKLPNYSKYLFVILIIFGTGKIIEIASGRIMPVVWLSPLNNYNFGIPVNLFATTYSLYIVFPASIILILLSIFIRVREVDKQQ